MYWIGKEVVKKLVSIWGKAAANFALHFCLISPLSPHNTENTYASYMEEVLEKFQYLTQIEDLENYLKKPQNCLEE